MRNSAAILAVLLLLGACSSGSVEPSDQEAREAEFERSMRNVTLQGHFTVSRDGEADRLREERYGIESVTKIAGDLWSVAAHIEYGDHDVTVPVPVRLSWAGDTPVIHLTDATIPGLGTFTARVMFYRDHYAGMWWHGETGGNQFGRILRSQEGDADRRREK